MVPKKYLDWISDFYSRMRRKAELDNQIRYCNRCPGLNEEGTLACPGFGNVLSPFFLLGQSLCDQCQYTQVPFTRASGDLIDWALLQAGLDKTQVFTTNVVHCHPPGNRPSTEEEIINCSGYLFHELMVVQPKVIICFGRDAEEAIINCGLRFAVDQGAVLEGETLRIGGIGTEICRVDTVRVYHPAYVLRKRSVEFEQKWVRQLVSILKNPRYT